MTGSRPAAWCRDLSKVYRSATAEVRALRSVTCQFPAGALTALLGPSGSGKSTLLRLLAGLDRPSGGEVEVGGVPVHRASGRALRRLRRHSVGYLFQRPSDNLLPYLTINEHLGCPAGPFGRSKAERNPVLERLGIGHRLQHLPVELSAGEQHRAALAILLASGRRIALVDEPTAALDTDSASRLMQVLREAVARGMTLVVASHDPVVRDAADHIVELSYGVLATGAKSHAGEHQLAEQDRPPMPNGDRGAGRDVVLELRGVSKDYRRGPVTVHAIRDATLDVHSGEVVGLVGRSGSGKTTLLNLAAGWEEPDGGVIRRPGKRVPAWEEVAVVPQNLGLFDEFTIRENVEYPARLAGTLDQLGSRIDDLIEALGLGDVEDRHPREASAGEQQRCAIARAVVLAPALLLADEPVGHQDEPRAEAVMDAIALAASGGTAALVATHGQSAVPFLDRALRIVDGIVPAAALQRTDSPTSAEPPG